MWISLKYKGKYDENLDLQALLIPKFAIFLRTFTVALQFLYYKEWLLHINFTVICLNYSN